MKYFRVEEEYITGNLQRIEVASDGEPIGDPYNVEWEDYTHQLILGYTVWELNKGGTTNSVEFYPVHTDPTTLQDDHEQVLEQIKADHPAGEWENPSW